MSHTFPLTGVGDAFELLEHEPDAAYKALIDLRADAGAAP